MRGGKLHERSGARYAIAAGWRDSRFVGALGAATAVGLVAFEIAASAQTLPTDGSVAAGSATISQPSAATLNINQTSSRAIVNWQSFSVGQGGTVNFNQPGASAATLNRVTGTTASSIAGQINAPGTVLLVNPNGIAITPTGTVNVGSFAASTLDIKNEDFLAGRYKFTGNGSSATVVNGGRINVSDGGFAALLGGRVANDGVIRARLGKVGLGSGERITLDLSGDGFLSVEVPSSQLGNITDSTGTALVSNKGKIRANGGAVFLSAATASNLLRDAVNVPGSIRANSVGTRNGRIVIGGGAGGRVHVSGQLSARGKGERSGRSIAAKGKGGQIDISGNEIALAGARLNVSGATGGGRIRIGGDYQGSGDLPHAQRVSIDSASVIRADAGTTGDGGTIIVWSDGVTSVSGAFSARAGANGGNGGLVETSGHELSFTGARVDTSARHGRAGDWLLDPENLTVDSAAAATIATNLATANVTLLTTSTAASGPGTRSNGAGDILIQSPIFWTSANRLTLNAYNSIAINAAITGQSGTLALSANGTVTQTAPISVASLALDFTGSYVLNNAANSVRLLSNTTGGGCCGGAIQLTTLGDLRITNVRAYGLTLNVGGSLSVTDHGILVPNNSQFIANVGGNVTFAGQENSFGLGTRVIAGGDIFINQPTNTWYGALLSSDRSISVNAPLTNKAGGTVALRAYGGSININNNIEFTPNGDAERLELTSLQNIVFNASNFGTTNPGPVQINASAAGDIRFNQAATLGSGSVFSAGGLIASEGTAPLRTFGGATFNSATDIYVNANVTNTGGGLLTLNADANGRGSGSVYMAPIGISSDGNVNIFYHPTSYGDPSYYPAVSGGGTLYAYKLVSTAEQFRQLSNVTGSNLLFALNHDIDFTGVTTTTSNQTPTHPLTLAESNLIQSFNGTLDGFNHALLNVTMNTWNADAAMIQNNNGTIRNLGIVGGSFFAQNTSAASLVLNNYGTLTNVFSTASVGATQSAGGLVLVNNGLINGASYATGNVSSAGANAGGLVAVNNRDINQAYATGNVSGRIAGGLVGINGVEGRIQYAYALGDVTGLLYTGGLAGENQWSSTGAGRNGCCGAGRGGGIISDTYAAGALSGSNRGGIVGNNQFYDAGNNVNDFNNNSHSSATVLYSVWDPYSTGVSSYAGRSYATVNVNFSSEQVQMVEALSQGGTTFAEYRVWSHPTDSTFTFDTQGFNANWYMIPGVTRPFLRSEFSTTIQNTHQLQLMNLDPTASYTLARNIDTAGELASGMWRSGSFSPIAPLQYGDQTRQYWNIDVYDYSGPEQNFTYVDQQSPTFVRTNNYIYHYGSGENVSYTETLTRREIVSVPLTAQNFTGRLDGRGHTIGGLSVVNTGAGAALFNNIGTGGVVTNLGIVDSSFSGGNLASAAALALTNFGTVEGVWASNSQVSGILQTGGLVGNNRGSITQSHANVNVSGGGGSAAVTGGLVGVNQGVISDSYSIGSVAGRGGSIVGGLVGFNLGAIANTYSTGVLSVSDGGTLARAGALVGVQGGSGTTVNSFYDVTTATHPAALNTLSVGTGLTTAQMQDLSTYASSYAGWDFRNVWAPSSSGSYAELYATSHVLVVGGNTTRTYGDANPVLTAAVYGLRSYDGTIAPQLTPATTSATAASNVGTYAVSSAIPTLSTITTPAPLGTLFGNYQFRINGVVLSFFTGGAITPQRVVDAINAQTGVHAALDSQGRLVLSSNSAIFIDGANNFDHGCFCVPTAYPIQVARGNYPAYAQQTISTDGSTYRVLNTAALTVTPRDLTVTALGGSSTYGDATQSNPGLQVTGLVNGDSMAGLSNSFNITNATNAGTYALNVNGTFNNANYNVTTQGSNWTVNRANLTVDANGGSSTYGDPTQPNPGLSVTGLRNSDTLGSLSNSFTITNLTNAGTYGLTVDGTFNDPNYNLTRRDGSWTVNRAVVDVTANSGTSIYGLSPANPGISATGLRNNEDVGVLAGLTNTFGITATTSRGTYGLAVAGNLATNANYTMRDRNPGSWVVDPAAITVTANGGTSTYGQSPTNPGLSATGLQNGEGVNVLAGLTNSFGVTNITNAGRHTLNVNGDLTNRNYVITTRNTGTWTVDPATITVTANGGRSVYGQSPASPGISATGLQNGESVSVLTGLTNTFGISSTTGVAGGPYVLAVAGALTNPNYSITTRNNGTWTVTSAPITVSANGGTSVYGSNPANPGLSATGLQNGEGVGVLTGLTNMFGVNGASHAGRYGLAVAGGLMNANYSITTRNDGVWNVTPASLTVTADPQSRLVGERDPLLSYRITAGQLFNGDLFTGVLARTGNELPGIYAVGQGTLALSQDYALSFVGSTFEIRAVPSDPTSQFIPPGTGTVGVNPSVPTNPVTITFQNPVTPPPVAASFVVAVEPVDPGVTAALTAPVTASLPRERRGLIFAPISQFDPVQYTNRTLPTYAPQAGEATVLTMIAKALASDDRDGIVIDVFWNTTSNNGNGATTALLLAQRATFSDGAGKAVSLDGASAFPLVAGTTDLAALLKAGPVIITGAVASDGTQSWMLAIGLTPDGKGLIANDAVSGRQVVLAWDPVTRMLGAVTGVVDSKTGAVIPIADAEAVKVAGLNDFNPNGTTALQSFAAVGYFAVSVR